MPVPHELAIGEVLFPPLLLALLLGATAAIAAGRLMNRWRLTELVYYPPLVLLAMTVLFTVLFGTFLFGM